MQKRLPVLANRRLGAACDTDEFFAGKWSLGGGGDIAIQLDL